MINVKIIRTIMLSKMTLPHQILTPVLEHVSVCGLLYLTPAYTPQAPLVLFLYEMNKY